MEEPTALKASVPVGERVAEPSRARLLGRRVARVRASGSIAPAALLAACGGGSGGSTASVPTASGSPVPIPTPTAAPTATPSPLPSASPTAVPSPTPTSIPAGKPSPIPSATPTPTPTPTPAPTPAPPSAPPPPATFTAAEAQASRFLSQATMGATRTGIADVLAKGYEGWLDEQFAMARSGSLWDALIARGEGTNLNGVGGYEPAVWRSLIVEPDQLRQRVGTALLDFLVVSMVGLDVNWPQFCCAGYLDILMDNAFGNYRTILEQISLNPAMTAYLSSINNKKANPTTGAMPDENYAREIMQLFSIGLHQLNMDGTLKLANGQPIETYTQNDVSQLARVFTGLIFPDWDWHKFTISRTPLIIEPSWNETGASTFLGQTVSGGGLAAIRAAVGIIFAHPNVPPFVSKQLIQRLVTSNPSPAYVGRVAAVFANNGAGVRGDLKAVVRAILLDNEARSDAVLTSNTAGRLRPPVQRFTAWARAFGVNSPSNAWAIGNTSSAGTGLGQSTGQAPNVFNFFRPGYTPPGSAAATLGLVAPEFQIANEQSVISYVNFMYKAVSDGIGDVQADYTSLLSRADNPQLLIDEVNLLLAAGQLSGNSIATIRSAVESASRPVDRIGIAILLTLAAPEFLVAR